MSSLDTIGKSHQGARHRAVRRPFYADWAIFFTLVAALGAVVMVELSTGGTSFVTGTIDRLNAADNATIASAQNGGDSTGRTVVYMSQIEAHKTTLASEETTAATQ